MYRLHVLAFDSNCNESQHTSTQASKHQLTTDQQITHKHALHKDTKTAVGSTKPQP